MTIAAIAVDVAQPRDVLLNIAAKRAFDEERAIENADDLGQLVFAQVLGAALRIDRQFLEDLAAVGAADAVQIRQADPDRLVGRNVYACDTGHFSSEKKLPVASYQLP